MEVNPVIPSILLGDANRLTQVLSNLVGNAVKFTSSGDITIEAHPLPPRNDAEFGILLTVSDAGMGMSAEILDELFTPFTQAERSHVRQFQGAGLGLAICKRLVSLMGGGMAVGSEEGLGQASISASAAGFPRCMTLLGARR